MKNEYRFGYDEMLIQIQACVPDSPKGDGLPMTMARAQWISQVLCCVPLVTHWHVTKAGGYGAWMPLSMRSCVATPGHWKPFGRCQFGIGG